MVIYPEDIIITWRPVSIVAKSSSSHSCTGIQIPRPCHLQIYGNSTIAAVGLQLSACPVNPYITKGKGYIEVLAPLKVNTSRPSFPTHWGLHRSRPFTHLSPIILKGPSALILLSQTRTGGPILRRNGHISGPL